MRSSWFIYLVPTRCWLVAGVEVADLGALATYLFLIRGALVLIHADILDRRLALSLVLDRSLLAGRVGSSVDLDLVAHFCVCEMVQGDYPDEQRRAEYLDQCMAIASSVSSISCTRINSFDENQVSGKCCCGATN